LTMGLRREGTITDVRGIRASGVACGIKPDGKKDLALVVSDVPCACAGVFTTNYVKAAPVLLTMRRVRAYGRAQAIVANSGNANCCTGERGREDAREMARAAAKALGIPERMVLVCSTGRIGRPLPMDKVRRGILEAAKALSYDGGHEAAEAIMTTDTRPKHASLTFRLPGGRATLGAICKGAGMIHPKMATMLCFVATDASLPKPLLQRALSEAVSESFNRITVDGDRSTNDTVLLLANGLSGAQPIRAQGEVGFGKFGEALKELLSYLAESIVSDGEGATRVIEVVVEGARSEGAADRLARSVANSLLVKTALHGAQPNFGRILAALGYAGVPLDPERVDVWVQGRRAVRKGEVVLGNEGRWKELLSRGRIKIRCVVGGGRGRARVLTCDLSEEYVRENAGLE